MAYNLAVEQRAFLNPDGSGTIVIRYTGNAGETPQSISYAQSLSTIPGADFVRGIAINQINLLNNTATFINSQVLPTTLDTTTPITPVASTFGSFIAALDPFTPGTTPTDIVTLYGSATKTINVTKASIVTTQTTAGINTWRLIKRRTVNTGGTSTAPTIVPTNSNFPAATATVLQYSVNPTGLGIATGNIWSGRTLAPGLASLINPIEVPMISQNQIPIVLVGVGQGLVVNFNGVALPAGLSVQVIFGWTEQ